MKEVRYVAVKPQKKTTLTKFKSFSPKFKIKKNTSLIPRRKSNPFRFKSLIPGGSKLR